MFDFVSMSVISFHVTAFSWPFHSVKRIISQLPKVTRTRVIAQTCEKAHRPKRSHSATWNSLGFPCWGEVTGSLSHRVKSPWAALEEHNVLKYSALPWYSCWIATRNWHSLKIPSKFCKEEMSFPRGGKCARGSKISLCHSNQETLQKSGKYKISM